jgi:hypothetical protein
MVCHSILTSQTLCEQVILRYLGRDSVPEYKATRERLVLYPRTAYFKREKVRDELDRMLADAKERGLPLSSVDSVYLQGEDAISEHEHRNGYDKPWGPTGVQKSLKDGSVFAPVQAKHTVTTK